MVPMTMSWCIELIALAMEHLQAHRDKVPYDHADLKARLESSLRKRVGNSFAFYTQDNGAWKVHGSIGYDTYNRAMWVSDGSGEPPLELDPDRRNCKSATIPIPPDMELKAWQRFICCHPIFHLERVIDVLKREAPR